MRIGRRHALLLLAAVLGVGLGASCLNPNPPSEPPAGCLPPQRALTNDERLGAMLSVRVAAYRAVGILNDITPAFVGLPSLKDAIETLKSERDPVGNARRRRAAAKLAAYGREAPDIKLALESLLCDHRKDLAAIYDFYQTNLETTPLSVESEIYSILADLGIPGCGPSELHPAPATVGNTSPPVSVTATALVSPSVDWVSKRIDPQRWDRCSLFFTRPPGCYLTTGPFNHTKACPVQPSTDNPPPTTGKPLGSAYTGRLFEYFECGVCQSVFKNTLAITTERQPTGCPACSALKYTVHYGEDPEGTLAGCVNQSYGMIPAELDEDGGLITAVPVASGGQSQTQVVSNKNLTLKPPGLDVPLFGMLKAAPAQEEMADELAEIACCPSAEP
jgi:hypothetical protein